MKKKFGIITLSVFAVCVVAVLCCGCSRLGFELLLRILSNGKPIKDGRTQLKNDTGLVIPESADYIYGRIYKDIYGENTYYIFVVDEIPSDISVNLADFETTDEHTVGNIQLSIEVDKNYPSDYEPDWEQDYRYYRAITDVEETTHYLDIAYCVDTGRLYIALLIDYNNSSR